MLELPTDIVGSKNASGLDPLGSDPIERKRRIEAMRAKRFREDPDSDLNILLFAYDEMRRDLDETQTQLRHHEVTKTGASRAVQSKRV